MHNQARMEFIMDVYRLIFSLNPNDPGLHQSIQGVQIDQKWTPHLITFQGRMFKDSATGLLTIRGFDASLNTDGAQSNGTIAPLNLRFIEQNPNKVDGNGNLKTFANLARQGHQIMWVINKDIQNGFLGRVQNGQWHKSQQFATRPVQTTQILTGAATNPDVDQYGNPMIMKNGQWIVDLPNINKTDVVEHVIECLDSGQDGCQFVED